MSILDDLSESSSTDSKKIKKELEKLLIKTAIAADISGQKGIKQFETSNKVSEQKEVLKAAVENAVSEVDSAISGKAAKNIVKKAESQENKIPSLDLGTSL